MSQSEANQTSGETDCSEAMEALSHWDVKATYASNGSCTKFVAVQKAMADDAGNRAVQKTHPENQDGLAEGEAVGDMAKCSLCGEELETIKASDVGPVHDWVCGDCNSWYGP